MFHPLSVKLWRYLRSRPGLAEVVRLSGQRKPFGAPDGFPILNPKNNPYLIDINLVFVYIENLFKYNYKPKR